MTRDARATARGHRLRWAAVACVAAHALGAGNAAAHTHLEISAIYRAGDGTSPVGASWRSWSGASPGLVVTGPPGDDVVKTGGASFGRLSGDVGPARLDVDDLTGLAAAFAPAEDRTLVVETELPGDTAPCVPRGYFAVTRNTSVSAGAATYPDSELVPIPEPALELLGGDVRVTWAPAGGPRFGVLDQADGVDGYVVLRSPGGRSFTEVARVHLATADPLDVLDRSVPPGRWLYEIRMIFTGEVLGRHVSRAAVVTLAGAVTDGDADGVQDALDNCPAARNTCQDDGDGDGVGDACDTADGLVPITSVTRTRVEWQDERPLYESFDVYRGDLATLRARRVYTQVVADHPQAARTCALTTNVLDDATLPAAGEALFYLVAGRRGLASSTLGSDSLGAPRPNTQPCP